MVHLLEILCHIRSAVQSEDPELYGQTIIELLFSEEVFTTTVLLLPRIVLRLHPSMQLKWEE